MVGHASTSCRTSLEQQCRSNRVKEGSLVQTKKVDGMCRVVVDVITRATRPDFILPNIPTQFRDGISNSNSHNKQ